MIFIDGVIWLLIAIILVFIRLVKNRLQNQIFVQVVTHRCSGWVLRMGSRWAFNGEDCQSRGLRPYLWDQRLNRAAIPDRWGDIGCVVLWNALTHELIVGSRRYDKSLTKNGFSPGNCTLNIFIILLVILQSGLLLNQSCAGNPIYLPVTVESRGFCVGFNLCFWGSGPYLAQIWGQVTRTNVRQRLLVHGRLAASLLRESRACFV